MLGERGFYEPLVWGRGKRGPSFRLELLFGRRRVGGLGLRVYVEWFEDRRFGGGVVQIYILESRISNCTSN